MSAIIDHSKRRSALNLSVITLSCMMLATNESHMHTREPTYDNAQYKISNWPFLSNRYSSFERVWQSTVNHS